jgi:hypothetical protein
MPSIKSLLLMLVPVVALGACTTLSDQDRALLESASKNAAEAKAMAQQALDASQAAQKQAQEADARADRIFQKSLRK